MRMSSKASKLFLNYFYYTKHFFGFVVVNLNVREKRATASIWKLFYALLWIVFFVLNFFSACLSSSNGFEEVYFSEETVNDTVHLEVMITYVMVILILLNQLKNIKVSMKLFTKLLRLSNVPGFCYKAFNDRTCCQISFFAVLSELGIIVLFVFNFYWMQRIESILNFNPFRNVLINTCLVVLPVSLVSNFSFFFIFCIDVVRQFLIFLIIKIQAALKLTKSSENISKLAAELNEIEQIYETALDVIKLFERNYGHIIVILQCFCMFIAINQVNESKSSNGSFKPFLLQIFYLYESLSWNVGMNEMLKSSEIIFCFLHLLQIFLVS